MTDTLPAPADVERIKVPVSQDIVRAIQHVMRCEDVNLAEATGRLLTYGDFFYRAVRDDGYKIELHRRDLVKTVTLINLK